jgi:membrane associated rhomboid family serine protease
MNTHTDGKPTRRRGTVVFFAVLLGLGLLMLIGRMLALPGFSAGEAIFPALGGLFIAVALAVIVLRDRRERAEMTPEERNRQDQGMPR